MELSFPGGTAVVNDAQVWDDLQAFIDADPDFHGVQRMQKLNGKCVVEIVWQDVSCWRRNAVGRGENLADAAAQALQIYEAERCNDSSVQARRRVRR